MLINVTNASLYRNKPFIIQINKRLATITIATSRYLYIRIAKHIISIQLYSYSKINKLNYRFVYLTCHIGLVHAIDMNSVDAMINEILDLVNGVFDAGLLK